MRLDTSGYSCPEPVIMTKKALKENPDGLDVIVLPGFPDGLGQFRPDEPVPLQLRNAIIPITNIGSQLSIPLVFIGYFLGMQPLVSLGILLFSLVTVFQLITLPVEFNASRRALATLDEYGMVNDYEHEGVRKVLSAAALTYVAALIVSLANLLRLILLFGGRRDD